MSSVAEQLSASRGLLKSLDAITNCRAFLTVLGTMVLGMVTVLDDVFCGHCGHKLK